MRGMKLRGKNLSRFLFFVNIFGWKENKRKENKRRIIFFYLFA